MKTYSISDAARIFEIDRKTLRRWIRKKQIPTPALGIVNGRPSKVWTDKELVKIRQYFESGFWGKGIDRRTGKKAKGKKAKGKKKQEEAGRAGVRAPNAPLTNVALEVQRWLQEKVTISNCGRKFGAARTKLGDTRAQVGRARDSRRFSLLSRLTESPAQPKLKIEERFLASLGMTVTRRRTAPFDQLRAEMVREAMNGLGEA